jgi:tetratricopeptide (TPR) repeat protein
VKRNALWGAAILASSIGCTPAGLWGNEARYAPDFRGYVIDRSPESSAKLLLKSPIGAKKLRCREDLELYLAPLTRERATLMHDENLGLAATLPPALTVMFPVGGAGVMFEMAGTELLAPPEGLYRLMRSPSRDSLYESGKRAFDEQRFTEAERLFVRALAREHTPPIAGGLFDSRPAVETQRAMYFLGILYEKNGRPRDATRAYRQFIERADVRDEKAYDDAEKRLLALDSTAIAPCQSQAPLTFTWPAPRR